MFLGIICALKSEAAPIVDTAVIRERAEEFKPVFSGTLFGTEFALIVSGVGKVNAAISTQYIIDRYKPDALLNIGVTGALFTDTHIGELFYVKNAIEYDFDLSAIDDVPCAQVDGFSSPLIPVSEELKVLGMRAVTLASADKFSSSEENARIIRALGGELVDMEGAAIAHTAYMNKIKLYSVKSVSDFANNDAADEYPQNAKKAITSYVASLKKIIEVIV